MLNTLHIAMLQTDISWENALENHRKYDKEFEKIAGFSNAPHLIVLPEMFNTGFTMNTRGVAQTMDGKTVQWLKEKSLQTGAVICGSIVISENNQYYNRFLWAQDGKIKMQYDKRHLFRMADEDKHFAMGAEMPEVLFQGWRVMPRICYDLRFPVWNRSNDIDLQIYVACWPQAREIAWKYLLRARAIENQCYVVGVNRIGKDGNQISYNGHSIVINPKGEALTLENNTDSGWIQAKINRDKLEAFRKKFPVFKDADSFRVSP